MHADHITGLGALRDRTRSIRRAITVPTALILAGVFGISADFWLNTQRRAEIWEAMNSRS